jgi:hypothetical protein
MRTRDQKVRLAAARHALNGTAQNTDASSAVAEQMSIARLAMPSQLHRRSIAALYARQKEMSDFRRVSRKLFQLH